MMGQVMQMIQVMQVMQVKQVKQGKKKYLSIKSLRKQLETIRLLGKQEVMIQEGQYLFRISIQVKEFSKTEFPKYDEIRGINESARALTIEWNLFNPSENYFVYCRIVFLDLTQLFEFSVFGAVIPSHIYTGSFRIDHYKKTLNDALKIIDIIRPVFSLYYFYMAIYMIVLLILSIVPTHKEGNQ